MIYIEERNTTCICKNSWMLTNPSIIFKVQRNVDHSDRKDKIFGGDDLFILKSKVYVHEQHIIMILFYLPSY